MVTGPVEAWAVQPFKPLDDGIRRTWPIVVRNRSKEIRKYRLSLVTTDPLLIVATWDPNNTAVKVLGTDHQWNVLDLDAVPCMYTGADSSARIECEPHCVRDRGCLGSSANVRVPSPIRVLVDDLSTRPQ